MDSTGEPWELVLVDDGSTDGSTDKIRELAAGDKCVRPVIFARNFGHQIAITAGWDYARGDAVVIIDADLQDPPEVILELAEKWKEGYEVVYAVRAEREGESWFKLWTASLFYRLINRITDVALKSTQVTPGMQIVERLYGMLEIHFAVETDLFANCGTEQTGEIPVGLFNGVADLVA